jgi:hypothetical protein
MAGGADEHVEKVRNSKFNRQRAKTETLRANCGSDGYVFTSVSDGVETAAGQCEFHHVLPVESTDDANILKDSESAEEKEFIHRCMAKTTWDTNEQPNLIGLPTKRPYYNADLATGRSPPASVADLLALEPQLAQFGALPNLPCHLNDHNKYNVEVIGRLDTNLWQQLVDGRDLCKDKGCSIRAMLRAESNTWKAELQARGNRQGGAADCWVNRHTTKRAVWHIPLSMAASPVWSEPPPRRPKSISVKEWLKKIFEWKP